MNAQRVSLLASALVACLAAASCTFDEKANAAKGCGACAPGMCYFGFCVEPATGVSPVGDGTGGGGLPNGGGGGDHNSSGGSGQGGSDQGGSGQSGVAGGGSGNGGNGGGGGAPTGQCPGGATPEDESCNAEDDDCDGVVDEDIVLGSCAAQNGGTCGGVMRCEDGKSVCDAKAGPTAEVCNGMDDDCDGVVDNDSDLPCFPSGTPGCAKNDDGSFDCVGLCKAGVSLCENGQPAACADFIGPSDEQCGEADAEDEDCDGDVDDNCPCSGDQTQSCYSGPAFTRRVGTCRVGTQHCVNSVFGECEGQVTPVDETCQNQGADNDCNLVRDDVFLAGFFCTAFGAKGACSNGTYGCSGGDFACLPGQAAATETSCDGIDEDCDGKIDENFDLQNDERNCGSCGNPCASGDLCCAGVCRDVDNDEQHCGSCSGVCNGNNTLCCDGACVPTDTNQHCGSCAGCAGGTACCDRACVATNTMAHCGGCAACNGDACCDGECVQTDSDDHCGSCNGCGDGSACCNDQCVPAGPGLCSDCAACPGDQLCCSGTCVSPGPDAGVVCP